MELAARNNGIGGEGAVTQRNPQFADLEQGDPVVRSARVSDRFLAAVVAVNNYDAQHQELIGQATAEREVLVAEMWATVQS